MVETPVQPLEWSVKVKFYPTGCRGDRLASIFRPPAFDEAKTNRAHPRQLIDGLESLGHRLSQEGGEFLDEEGRKRAVG